MLITGKIKEVKDFLKVHIINEAGIGFVPTMGALHEGHISLIDKAKEVNQVVVASIFVNPAQFHDQGDLAAYPRTPDADHNKLEDAGCDLLFEPLVSEMYPNEGLLDIDFGDLERVMEGKYRPGHFKGVATVVSRLFEIVTPDRSYFGEKDYQQLAVIRELNKRLRFGIEIVGCPTMREKDGLALSSRNIHLTKEERVAAPVIFQSLCYAAESISRQGPAKTAETVKQMVESFPGFKVQYIEFVDAFTLQPITTSNATGQQRACIAVQTSTTRLIDNVAI